MNCISVRPKWEHKYFCCKVYSGLPGSRGAFAGCSGGDLDGEEGAVAGAGFVSDMDGAISCPNTCCTGSSRAGSGR